MNHRQILMFLILSLLFCQSSIALPDDREKVAQLSANTANLNQQTHSGEYLGDVQFDQGTTHLRAIKAITKGNQENKLTYAVAFGDNKTRAHYWEQTSLEKPILHAYAKEIHYYPERHLIELIGNAEITQGNNSFSAPKINYDTLKQHVVTFGAGKQRTIIIFIPEKKS